jgi:hypothetical protein
MAAAAAVALILAVTGPMSAPRAQAVDAAAVQRLQQLIEQQQAQIAAQARMLEALQGEVRALARSAQESATAANAAQRTATQAAATAEQASAQAANAPVPEKTVTSGKKGIKLAVSGQVNRGVLFVDDGAKTHAIHVDNDNSSTRIRFVAEGRLNEEFKVGAHVEVQFESNSSGVVNQFNERGVGPNNFTERKLEVYLDSKTFGRLWIGQGDTASNGVSERDLSGTSVAGYSAVHDLAGGMIFVRSGLPQAIVTDPSIGATFTNLDGLSRDDRVRYDTPKWNGFHLRGSVIANGRWDVGGRFAGKVWDTKLAAALAYWSRPGREGVSGSISGLHASGINLSFAGGNADFTSPAAVAAGRFDSSFWYVKLGYLNNFLTSAGKTGIAVDYFNGNDQAANFDEGEAFGVFLVQNLDKVATELYVGGRVYDLDRRGRNFDSIAAVLAGARIKF